MTLGASHVLVTGGGTGIGRAIAEAVVAAGGRVAIVGRRVELLEALAKTHPPGTILPLAADLEAPESRAGLLRRAKEALGGLDGFVSCAGNCWHQPLGDVQESALRSQLELNLVAPLRLAEEALIELAPGGGIVFVGSTLADRPVRTSAVYSAAKAGLVALAKVVALEGAPRAVRANVVVPGVVDTAMVRAPREARATDAAGEPEARLEALRRLHALGRLGAPEDIARTVVHLLTASWVTGSAWTVDGGLLLR